MVAVIGLKKGGSPPPIPLHVAVTIDQTDLGELHSPIGSMEVDP